MVDMEALHKFTLWILPLVLLSQRLDPEDLQFGGKFLSEALEQQIFQGL